MRSTTWLPGDALIEFVGRFALGRGIRLRVVASSCGIGREYLDQVLFWNGADLQRKLDEFKDYYNRHRVHSSLKGKTPCEQAGHPCPRQADLRHFMWRSHCGGLFQLPVAA